MKIHLLTGFLGSGKTTAIKQAAQALIWEGHPVGVITNDQGSRLVDGDFFQSLDIPGRQVMNGCFCCNYQHLDENIQSLISSEGTTTIFAESVGSCTDIVATVLKPLLQFRPGVQVTVSTFADIRLLKMIMEEKHSFDHSVTYIYLKQLEEAGIIVVNKADLVSATDLSIVKQMMQDRYSDKILLYQDSQDVDDIKRWLFTLDNYQDAGSLQSLRIDYDLYAQGEANMAWYDQNLEIFSNGQSAAEVAKKLINTIYTKINERQYTIGHLKFLLNGKEKISFTAGSQPLLAAEGEPVALCAVLVNLRVQQSPEAIEQLVKEAIQETEIHSGCKIISVQHAAFQPGYPKPAYRL